MAVLAPVNVTIGCLLMLSVQHCQVDDEAQVQSLYHYLIIRWTGSGGGGKSCGKHVKSNVADKMTTKD